MITAPARLTQLKYHPVQQAFYRSESRFNVCPAGRRSGKTEIAKRRMIRKALRFTGFPDGRGVIAAPTRPQVKSIYWADMKALSPKALVKDISESRLAITYVNGYTIELHGMDRPERIEGTPIDDFLGDEVGNMKPHAWPQHVRPALSTPGRLGRADFIGVPEGMNHYYDLWKRATKGVENWAGFHWPSSDILDPEEIAQAKEELDEISYRQEYEGSFVTFQGVAYFAFNRELHATERVYYKPDLPIYITFDFNVSPGVAVITQEQEYEGRNPHVADEFTAVIGEVYIPRHSNTRRICEKVIHDWGMHPGDVYLDGDATGGASDTRQDGNDWTIINAMLKPVFKDRLHDYHPTVNPGQRARVLAMNSRLRSLTGTIRMLFDPVNAPKTIEDCERTQWLEGAAGEIDKSNPLYTHLTDALGYKIHRMFPTTGPTVHVEQLE